MVKDLNGASFKDRQIYVKLHVPFSPKGKPIFGINKKRLHSNAAKAGDDKGKDKDEEAITKTNDKLEKEEKEASDPNSLNIEDILLADDKTKASDNPQKKLSKDTIFIGNAHDKTTDEDVRAFFSDYAPTQVFIYRRANQKRMEGSISLRQRTISLLVTLKSEDSLPLALTELSSKKLRGKYVKLKPAYLAKIEEVLNAAKLEPATDDKGVGNETKNSIVSTDASTLADIFKDTQRKIQEKYRENFEKVKLETIKDETVKNEKVQTEEKQDTVLETNGESKQT